MEKLLNPPSNTMKMDEVDGAARLVPPDLEIDYSWERCVDKYKVQVDQSETRFITSAINRFKSQGIVPGSKLWNEKADKIIADLQRVKDKKEQFIYNQCVNEIFGKKSSSVRFLINFENYFNHFFGDSPSRTDGIRSLKFFVSGFLNPYFK